MGIKIKLIKSPSSASARQVATVKGLGVWKFGSEKLLKDTPAIRGMLDKVRHLVAFEIVKEEPTVRARTKPRKIRARDASRAKAAAKAK
ncbi:MAG: 50S ribosomal protein L30 [Archangium gephyra]|uniref:50S ribosomal protein L30 n=1 Tax=Archangium gephyra TaxID=48 RepID=A0A2W5T343_9BACT|nr:MAG: 50S ribosomal protein L30 [Archangium gephyra]